MSQLLEHTDIANLKENTTVSSVYLCKECKVATKKDGSPYLNLTLMDSTGSASAKFWTPPADLNVGFAGGDFVFVEAAVGSYNGALDLKINSIRKAEEGSYIPEMFFPVSNRDFNEMRQELLAFVNKVDDPDYHNLLVFIFKNQDIYRSYLQKSAAKSMHQNYIHGLLEHSLSVTRLCETEAQMYPTINKSLLLTAALLHDIGKIRELSDFPKNDYTIDGSLFGHLVMGYQMLSLWAKQIPGFPEDKLRDLEHCIVSHHGKREWGSPEVPQIAEAMALHLADMIDSRMAAFEHHIAVSKPDEEGWYPYLSSFESRVRLSAEKAKEATAKAEA